MSCESYAPVVFDYAAWILRYPEFAGVVQSLATRYFAEAGLICDNSSGSIVPSGAPNYQRDTYLNMLTAHIAFVSRPTGGQNAEANQLVGRISSATEGTVSVSTQLALGDTSAMAAYLSQSPYGMTYLAATAGLRRARYVPSRGAARFGRRF